MLSNHCSKFHPIVVSSVFVGYSPGIKGYKLYDIENHKFFISRDVVVHESVFSFHDVTAETDIHDPFLDSVVLTPFFFVHSESTTQYEVLTTNQIAPSAIVSQNIVLDESNTVPCFLKICAQCFSYF